jgi:hypothetical protein
VGRGEASAESDLDVGIVADRAGDRTRWSKRSRSGPAWRTASQDTVLSMVIADVFTQATVELNPDATRSC